MLVVKIGGAEGLKWEAICDDVLRLYREGRRLVLVHGGSAEANALAEALGHPPQFVTSPSGFTSRYTDAKALDIFAMAVLGRVNARLVEALVARGVPAVGLTGMDGGLLVAKRKANIRVVEDGKTKILHGDYTGRVETVHPDLLRRLLEDGYVPVVAPLAISTGGEMVNVDGDRAAAALAVALQAETLLLLTAAPGLLRRFPDPESLIPQLPAAALEQAMTYAQGRMKKKVLAAQEAIQGGVPRVIIGDGRVTERPIFRALEGAGTHILGATGEHRG